MLPFPDVHLLQQAASSCVACPAGFPTKTSVTREIPPDTRLQQIIGECIRGSVSVIFITLGKIIVFHCYFKTILLLPHLFLCYFIWKEPYFNSIIILYQNRESYFIHVLPCFISFFYKLQIY